MIPYTTVRAFGFGANYSGTAMEQPFIDNGVACIGWSFKDAPELYQIMSDIQTGDVVFLKRFGPNSHTMTVLGIGVCTDPKIEARYDYHNLPPGKSEDDVEWLGCGVEVEWLYCDPFQIKSNLAKDKLRHHRLGSIYREYNPLIIYKLVSKLNHYRLDI